MFESLISGFVAGILANLASPKVSNFLEDFSKNNKFINHDLQRAVKKSFLRAIEAVVVKCLEKAKLSRNDIKWLEQKQAAVKDALKQLEKTEFPDMPLESLREIELLFRPSGGMATEQFLQIVEEKLIAEALENDAAAPEPYKEKIRTDVFKRMCDYFAWEIKNTPEVRCIFDSQTLAQIDVRLIELGSTVDEAKEAVYEVKKTVKEIKEILCPSKPGIIVELDADFNKLGIPELWAVIEKLQGIVKGKMTGIEAGSVKIFLEGTQEGIEQLESLFRSGELTEILGVPVKDVSIQAAPAFESKPSDAGEEGIVEKAKTWLSSLLWIPEGAGLPVTAADTSEQEKTFQTDEGEFTVTCVWEGEIKEYSAYIWLSWKAEIKPDVEFVIQFLNPATKEVRYEICPGKLRKGTATLKKEKLGFDPTKDQWGIYVEVKERKPE